MVNLSGLSRLTNSLGKWRLLSTRLVGKVDGVLREALPGRCDFCLSVRCQKSPAGVRPWCTSCHEALPWNLPACPCCAEPQPGQLSDRRCGACLATPCAFERARVPLIYSREVTGLVQRFKFHASPRAGRVLLELLSGALGDEALRWPEALMAVPLHPARARERGFDQAEWLASRLARRLGIPHLPATRIRDTRSQRGLDRRERRRNLKGAFRVPGPLPGRLVLIDDVMTTGATLDALAVACRRAGAREIEVWACARTPLD